MIMVEFCVYVYELREMLDAGVRENAKEKIETGTKRRYSVSVRTTELQYVAVQLAVVLFGDIEVQQRIMGLYG